MHRSNLCESLINFKIQIKILINFCIKFTAIFYRKRAIYVQQINHEIFLNYTAVIAAQKINLLFSQARYCKDIVDLKCPQNYVQICVHVSD